MPQFDETKFLDFWEYYETSSLQHREAARRLYREILAVKPDLLTDEAYWVEAYRKRPAPSPLPPTSAQLKPSGKVSIQSKIKIQAQHMPKSCGQTCVAMSINYLGARNVDDYWVNQQYGYNLLGALNENSGGKKWADVGNFNPNMWDSIYNSIKKGFPVIIGLNGPEFSPSGYGHIVMIVSIDGNNVGIADPNGGVWRMATKQLIETCPDHTEGKFVFMVV